jgi:hypothetical protein
MPYFTVRGPVPLGVALDASTVLWIAAVAGAGGSVSGPRQTIVNNLIVGLKADGLFTKLDQLYLFASEDSQAALIDIIALNTAALQNAPAFTADAGYQGGSAGDAKLITTNYTGGGQFSQNSANIFAWNNTAGVDAGGNGGSIIGYSDVTSGLRLFPAYSDGNLYWDILDAADSADSIASAGVTGLYLMNRTTNILSTLDINGTEADSHTDASGAQASRALAALGGFGGEVYSSRQLSCFGFGSQLSGGERTAIYNRLRTYMTAVGVP